MNQFIAKQDYFGLADGTMLVCTSSDDGKSNEVAEATGQDGSIIAHNVYGQKMSPSNDYTMKATSFIKTAGQIKIGGITTLTDTTTSICLNNFSIGTAGGSAPTISASGEQVEDSSSNNCTYSVPAFTLTKKHHAQVLFGAFNDDNYGTGVHLKSASYTFSGNITKSEKDGTCLSHDISEGKIECSVEFVQTGSASPTLTAGEGWEITSVLASSNPDSDWPTWSATLTKYLVKDTQVANNQQSND